MENIKYTEYFKKDVGGIRSMVNISDLGIEIILEKFDKGKHAKLEILSIEELMIKNEEGVNRTLELEKVCFLH